MADRTENKPELMVGWCRRLAESINYEREVAMRSRDSSLRAGVRLIDRQDAEMLEDIARFIEARGNE